MHLANSPQLPEGGQNVGKGVLRGRLQFSRRVAPKAQKDNVAMTWRDGEWNHIDLSWRIYLGYEPQRIWETVSHYVLLNRHRKLRTKSIWQWKLASYLENHEVRHDAHSKSSWGYFPNTRHRQGEAIKCFYALWSVLWTLWLTYFCNLLKPPLIYFTYNCPKISQFQQRALLKTHMGTHQVTLTHTQPMHTVGMLEICFRKMGQGFGTHREATEQRISFPFLTHNPPLFKWIS